jgi:hypothetical protein
MDKIMYTPETSLPVTSGLQSIAYPSSLWPLNTFTGVCLWIMSSSLGAGAPDSAKELRKELKSHTCIFKQPAMHKNKVKIVHSVTGQRFSKGNTMHIE